MRSTVAQKGTESEQLFCSVALNHASVPEVLVPVSYRTSPGLCCVVSAGQVDARWRNLANRGGFLAIDREEQRCCACACASLPVVIAVSRGFCERGMLGVLVRYWCGTVP